MVNKIPEIIHQTIQHPDHLEYQFSYDTEVDQTINPNSYIYDNEFSISTSLAGVLIEDGHFLHAGMFRVNSQNSQYYSWWELTDAQNGLDPRLVDLLDNLKDREALSDKEFDPPLIRLDNDPQEWFFSLSLNPLTEIEIDGIKASLQWLWSPSFQKTKVEEEVQSLVKHVVTHKDTEWGSYIKITEDGIKDHRDITFEGKNYRVGQDDINSAVNRALREVGSDYRIAISLSLNGKLLIIYGTIKEENHIPDEGGENNLIVFKNIEVRVNLELGTLAFNDGFYNIFIMDDMISEAIAKRGSDPKTASFKPEVYERLFQDFITQPEKNKKTAEEFLIFHEMGHSQFYRVRFTEYRFLANHLGPIKQRGPVHDGDGTLQILAELSADLNAIRHLAQMGQTDSFDLREQEKALDMLKAMTVLYGFQDSRENSIFQTAREMATLVLLGATSLDTNGELKVDWELMEESVDSLEKILDQFYEILELSYKQMAVATHPEVFGEQALPPYQILQLTLPQIKPLYEQVVRKVKDELKQTSPHLDEKRREQSARDSLVLETLNSPTPNFNTKVAPRVDLVLMAELLSSYRKTLDNWFGRNFTEIENLPFRYWIPE